MSFSNRDFAPYPTGSACSGLRTMTPPGPKRVPCKNGVPYDCNCNLIQAPYSMPFRACGKPQCLPSASGGYQYLSPPYNVRDS